MIYSDNEIIPENLIFNDVNVPVYTFDTVIVGSGAAGLGAASALLSMGQTNIAVITESMKSGASKNSMNPDDANNQSYYKISENNDSVRDMAYSLFNGFSMDGDVALVQAALSARCFYRLIDSGVDFPQNIYGEFSELGGLTRATNAGAFTAKKIAEAAERDILDRNVPVFNRFRVISIIKAIKTNEINETGLTEENAAGILAVDKDMQRIYAEKIQEYNLQTRIKNANKNIFGKIQERLDSANSKINKKNNNNIVKYEEQSDNLPEPEKPSGNEFGYVLFKASNIIYAVGGPAGIYEEDAHLYPQNMTCSLGAAFMAGVKGKNLTETVFKTIESNIYAYHLNGGLDCDIFSESNIKHFFPVGEAAAVFGVNIPDGASLAATQITAFRAAEKIAKYYGDYNANPINLQDFGAASANEVCKYIAVARHLLKNAKKNIVSENILEMRKKYQKRFSGCCMAQRSLEYITLAVADCRFDMANFINDNKIDDITYLSGVFENHDILITQYVFLQAVRNYILSGGKSRGSYIIAKKEPEPEVSAVNAVTETENPETNSINFDELVSFLHIKNANTFEVDFSTRKVKDIP